MEQIEMSTCTRVDQLRWAAGAARNSVYLALISWVARMAAKVLRL